MIAIIDMDAGNLKSVMSGLERVGLRVRVCGRPEEVEAARAVILPGVGAYGDGMARLREKGLVEPLRRHALAQGKPLLGICLGMQILSERGEEHGSHEGLGVIRGRVVRLVPDGPECRVPNMGWHDVTACPDRTLFSGLPETMSFYFAHSYHVACDDPADVAATLEYGGQAVTAAIERGNVFGVQFHPEKSQDAGLDVLHNWAARLGLL